MKLSRHFTLDELIASESAARLGLTNEPTGDVLDNLKATAAKLDAVRDLLGHLVFVSSGYRSPAVNVAVGGSKTSAHCRGLAVDFRCSGYGSPLEVARKIAESPLQFDQLIHEFERWVHIGFAAAGKTPRRQLLTINTKGTRQGLHP